MHGDVVGFGDGTKGLDFCNGIDRAVFGGCGDGQSAFLDVVHADLSGCGYGLFEGGEIDFGIGPIQQCQLCATGIEFRGAAFVFLYVRVAVAVDRLPRLYHRC